MIQNSQIQTPLNLDINLLNSANEVIKNYGLNISEAINIFLQKIKIEGKLPFEIDNKVYDTPKQEVLNNLQKALNEVKQYNQNKIEFKTLDEVLKDLWS